MQNKGEFHKTGSKLFVQLSAGMGRSMAINEIMVKMLQNKAFGAVGWTSLAGPSFPY